MTPPSCAESIRVKVQTERGGSSPLSHIYGGSKIFTRPVTKRAYASHNLLIGGQAPDGSPSLSDCRSSPADTRRRRLYQQRLRPSGSTCCQLGRPLGWRTEGWWTFEASETGGLKSEDGQVRTENGFLYVYAEATDASNLVWEADNKDFRENIGGTSYNMIELELEAEDDGSWVLPLTCEGV